MAFNLPQQQEEDDGNWIFSYADMMSLLCAFFILLYKVTADEEKMKRISERIRETMAGVDDLIPEQVEMQTLEERKARAFEMLSTMVDLGDSVEDAVGNIERKFSDDRNAESYKRIFEEDLDQSSRKHLEILKKRNIDEDVLVTILLPSDTTFAFASADVQPDAQAAIAGLASSISKIQDLVHVEITGHTDSTPTRKGGFWMSNWQLSSARASAVAQILESEGIPGELLHVRGRSHFQPLFPEENVAPEQLEENRKHNRRIAIHIKRRRYQETP